MDRQGSSASPSEDVDVAPLTSGTFLLAFLVLGPLGQSPQGLGRLLQLDHKDLDVVQQVVQDLLQRKKKTFLVTG